MAFQIGNQEWRKRKSNRGGRPTRHETAKRKALDAAKARGLKRWAELRADWILAGILGLDRGRCPLCEKIIKHHGINGKSTGKFEHGVSGATFRADEDVGA